MQRTFLLLIATIFLFSDPVAASGEETFFAMVASGDVAGVEAALAEGQNIESRNSEGETPLILAAKNRSLPMVELLLRSGADIEARRRVGGTALHYAVAYGAPEIVRALLRAGADIEADGGGGQTPVFLTALFKKSVDPALNLQNLKILLEAGARIDITDETGATPLIHAGMLAFGLYPQEEVELIRTMLAAGADLDAEDRYGTTALTAWAVRGSPEAVKFLQQAGAKGNIHAGREMKAADLLLRFFGWKILGIPAAALLFVVLSLLGVTVGLRRKWRS